MNFKFIFLTTLAIGFSYSSFVHFKPNFVHKLIHNDKHDTLKKSTNFNRNLFPKINYNNKPTTTFIQPITQSTFTKGQQTTYQITFTVPQITVGTIPIPKPQPTKLIKTRRYVVPSQKNVIKDIIPTYSVPSSEVKITTKNNLPTYLPTYSVPSLLKPIATAQTAFNSYPTKSNYNKSKKYTKGANKRWNKFNHLKQKLFG